MRVLHVIPSVAERSGGPATAIVPMCRALQQHGVDVLLVTTDAGMREAIGSGGKPPFQTCSLYRDLGKEQPFQTCSLYRDLEKEQVRKGGLPPLGQYRGVPAIFFPTQLGESFKYSRPLATWLNSHLREFDLAHIHAVFNHSSIAAAHGCRKAGVPYVVRPLGTLEPWSMTQKSLRKRVFWQIAGKAMLQRAAAVHYTTDAEQSATEALLGLNHGKVIGLGVIAEQTTSCAKQKVVLVLSRLHPKKGLDVLIEAFLSLTQEEKFNDWRLVIAGDGPHDHVSKLRQMAAGSDKIVFTGWLDGDAKDNLLNSASLLALPSRQENFGMCVIEALSRAMPVLVSPHVNLAEEIVLANAGWIATVDKESLSTRLAEALDDEEERARRGQAGKQLSLKYSWENAAKSLKALYTDVVMAR